MSDGRWSDLTTRVASAVVLVLIGAIEVWLGGLWFETFVAAACGVMIWELVRMVAPERTSVAIQLSLLTAVVAGPLARRETWAWWAVVGSATLWFVLDTGLSLALGFVGHAAFNVGFAVALAVPLAAIRRDLPAA